MSNDQQIATAKTSLQSAVSAIHAYVPSGVPNDKNDQLIQNARANSDKALMNVNGYVPTAPPSTLVDQLIDTRPDHANPHSIVFNDPPLSWSWGRHGTEDTKVKGALSWTLGSWYGVGKDKSILNTPTPTVRFNIRRLAFWNYFNNVWVKMGDQLPTWYVVTPPSGGNYSDDTPRIEPDGSKSFALPTGMSLHGADGSWPWRHIDGGSGVITLGEARLIGPPADIAALAGKIGMTVGADYRDAAGSGGDSTPGYSQSFFGQIQPLDGNWHTYLGVATPMTDAELRASSPPLG